MLPVSNCYYIILGFHNQCGEYAHEFWAGFCFCICRNSVNTGDVRGRDGFIVFHSTRDGSNHVIR